MTKLFFLSLSLAALAGCVSVTPGPVEAGIVARKVQPSPGLVAIYFCREWGFMGGGIELYPRINGKIVGKLVTKTFTRVDIPPGEYEIALGYYDSGDSAFFKATAREPVKMENIQAKADEIYQYWIGVAGSSVFGGALTIDHFDSKAQAMSCIENAMYVSPRPF